MKNILSNLNTEQKRAVTHREGPLLVIAGAGTGKTTVITHRIAHIISRKWAKPSEILALTFTDKAAGEMEERVDLLVPYGFVDTWISTFHAFGDRILREHSIDLGLPANFKILSKTEQIIFLRENIFAFELKYFRPLSNPLSHVEELINHFSRLKDELIAPADYTAWAQNQKISAKGRSLPRRQAGASGGKSQNKETKLENEKSLELANAYQRYQDLMIQAGNLDYGDQIYLTYKLLSENKNVLKLCQKRFKYILVDEFQDTNYAQYQIVRLLSQKHKNLAVVGDDDQSIYRFRGASISNILSFKKDYPKCKQVVLNQNFRSTQQILDASYKLIRHNNPDRLEIKNKIDKRLKSSKRGVPPELLHCLTLSCEADQVAKKIQELKRSKKYSYKDFAILARANNHLVPFMQSLNSLSIPNVFAGSSSLLQQPEIKMLIAFLKSLVYDDDNLSFFHLATSEIYQIDPETMTRYYTQAKRSNRKITEIFATANEDNKQIAEIISDLENYRKKFNEYSAGEILYDFLKSKKYLKRLTRKLSVENEVKIANIAKFFERIFEFDQTATDRSVHNFLQNLELIIEAGDDQLASDIDPDLDAVNVMTVHSAKGLEWPVVFVVNMVADRFPSRDRREKIPIPDKLIKEKLPEKDFHLQEERRLFYVATTRAKDYLYISSAEDYGGKRAKKLSQFVMEMLDDPNLGKIGHKLSPIEKIARHGKEVSSLPAGRQGIRYPVSSMKQDKILKLSRQQIDDYFTCPKKYYFASVVKIPLPTNWHFVYGTAIHEAIGRYYARRIRGEKPDLQLLIDDFNQSFVSEGFITREHEEQKKKVGVETLIRFFEEDQKTDLTPEKVEEPFEFSEDNIKINGRYDLIVGKGPPATASRKALRAGEKVEILDYKTSDVKDQKDADRRIRESTQMKIYALAWCEKFNAIPKTTLFFIESNLKGEKIFEKKDLDKTKEMIFEVAKGIKLNDFKAKPDIRQCSLCSYKDICPNSAA